MGITIEVGKQYVTTGKYTLWACLGKDQSGRMIMEAVTGENPNNGGLFRVRPDGTNDFPTNIGTILREYVAPVKRWVNMYVNTFGAYYAGQSTYATEETAKNNAGFNQYCGAVEVIVPTPATAAPVAPPPMGTLWTVIYKAASGGKIYGYSSPVESEVRSWVKSVGSGITVLDVVSTSYKSDV